MVDGVLLGRHAGNSPCVDPSRTRLRFPQNLRKETTAIGGALALSRNTRMDRFLPKLYDLRAHCLDDCRNPRGEEGLRTSMAKLAPLGLGWRRSPIAFTSGSNCFYCRSTKYSLFGRFAAFPLGLTCALHRGMRASYYLIERPAVTFGRKLYARSRAKSIVPA